eukprot:4672051-Amphidinium_carterae.1
MSISVLLRCYRELANGDTTSPCLRLIPLYLINCLEYQDQTIQSRQPQCLCKFCLMQCSSAMLQRGAIETVSPAAAHAGLHSSRCRTHRPLHKSTRCHDMQSFEPMAWPSIRLKDHLGDVP